MKQYILSFILIAFVIQIANSQDVNFTKQQFSNIKKLKTINFSQIDDPYQVSLINREAPNVSGNNYRLYLDILKNKISLEYPKNNDPIITNRGDADPPQIIKSFAGNNSATGIPLDNHLAMKNDQIISAINSHIAVKGSDGSNIKGTSLAAFALEVNLDGQLFDPRVLYDPESDRFILVFLHGSMSTETNIIVAFSATNDATGEWNVYSLPGNPNGNMTWTDYPMINVNQTDLIISGNLIRDDETWQLGFDETVIWQIDKTKGYNGEDLQSILYKDISFGGQNIRNLCPAESGDEILDKNTIFLSNRNFSIESDSFFIVELTGGINDPLTNLTIDVALSDISYGVPPNAEQEIGELQTNDARILEAFRHNNQIQFVGNTRNRTNNKAGIFHGIVQDVSGAKEISLEHIIGDDFEIGYPGISYTGDLFDEMDAIISFNHTSVSRFAGMSAMYYLPGEGYSDIISIKEGTGFINIIGGSLERWGDYTGTQRDYAEAEICWISGFYGFSNHSNFPWVAKLARPQATVGVKEEIVNNQVQLYPNPVSDIFSILFEIPPSSRSINIVLLDQNGSRIADLLRTEINKTGLSEFNFNISNLASGMYIISVKSDEKLIANKTLIVR